MLLRKLVIFSIVCLMGLPLFAQNELPDFTVETSSGRVVVSWKNHMTKKIANINIQRSFDSLKNYATIGAVLDAETEENGYLDAQPPYNAMFYRLFIAYEGGDYTITKAKRPFDPNPGPAYQIAYSWDLNNPQIDSSLIASADSSETPPVEVLPGYIKSNQDLANQQAANNNKIIVSENIVKAKPPAYPSSYMYTSRQSSIVINLPDAASSNYKIVVYDIEGREVFTLTNLKEDLLVLDKGNFPRSGWYSFMLFKDDVSVERNRFNVPKDPPKPNKANY